jgi:SEC-C motif-containing protein
MGAAAPTALALMRSRYSAYALGLAEYIIRTTHPTNPHYQRNLKKWEKEILRFSQNTQFMKLEIEGFGEDWVAFTATMMQGGRPSFLKEKSQFAKLNDKWLYLSGIITNLS